MTLADALTYLVLWAAVAVLFSALWAVIAAVIAAGLRRRRRL